MSVFLGARAKPFQFVQIIGAAGLGLGGLGLLATIAWGLSGGDSRSLMLGFLVSLGLSLLGFLTVVVGMVGEYLVGMNYEIGRHPKYLIRQTHE